GDSGIYLRGTPQVQIWDNAVGSGGLYNNQENPSQPFIVADNPPGEWNTFRIVMIGERVSVWLNDFNVVEAVGLENYWNRGTPIAARGPVELQAHGSELRFRNIFLRRIVDPEAERELLFDHRLDWWRQARFGMFIHWGPVSLRGTEIGWSRRLPG
ncbi:MAG: 3-keto-disaccharide hydrolase, partial [Planctomycetota bacterium]